MGFWGDVGGMFGFDPNALSNPDMSTMGKFVYGTPFGKDLQPYAKKFGYTGMQQQPQASPGPNDAPLLPPGGIGAQDQQQGGGYGLGAMDSGDNAKLLEMMMYGLG